MSVTWRSSKRFTQKKYVYIYTVQDISNHINTTSSTCTHPPNSQTVQKRCFANRERSVLWKDVFSYFSWKRREMEDVCRKRVPDFSCLKVERSVSSRSEVSLGDFQQFFTAGPKSSRRLVSVKQFWKVRRKRILKAPESKCGNFVCHCTFCLHCMILVTVN